MNDQAKRNRALCEITDEATPNPTTAEARNIGRIVVRHNHKRSGFIYRVWSRRATSIPRAIDTGPVDWSIEHGPDDERMAEAVVDVAAECGLQITAADVIYHDTDGGWADYEAE